MPNCDPAVVNRFISHLYSLRRALDGASEGNRRVQAAAARAALAQLRRAAGKQPGAAVEALPHVVPYLPEKATAWQRDAFFLVGALFASHPTPHESRENLGESLRRIGRHESAEKRFVALLNCPTERLDYQLRQAIRQAQSSEVPVNYRWLLFDLLDWDNPERSVQLKWAQAYWRPDDPAADAGGASATEDLEP
jgi:CRISPR system Cascade subunit CasB